MLLFTTSQSGRCCQVNLKLILIDRKKWIFQTLDKRAVLVLIFLQKAGLMRQESEGAQTSHTLCVALCTAVASYQPCELKADTFDGIQYQLFDLFAQA